MSAAFFSATIKQKSGTYTMAIKTCNHTMFSWFKTNASCDLMGVADDQIIELSIL